MSRWTNLRRIRFFRPPGVRFRSLVDVPKSVPQRLKPSSGPCECGTAEAVPFVKGFFLPVLQMPFVLPGPRFGKRTPA
jgi:hypothetical protein